MIGQDRVGFLGIRDHLKYTGAGQLVGEKLIHAVAHRQDIHGVHLLELRVRRGGKRGHSERKEPKPLHENMVPAPASRAGAARIVYKSQRITVIIPCLNEEQGIEQVMARMPDFVDQVIVVDNGSEDRTSEVARQFGAEVIREPVRGYGRSYKRGFASATGDIIVTLDGDHSYPPDAISYLIEALLHLNVDFLNASRFPVRDSSAMSFKHKFGNWMLSLAMSILYFRWVRDSQSGMWVFRRPILKSMQLTSDGMAFSEEIKIEALKNSGIRFAEISILYSSRLGEIKLNPWRDGMYNLLFLVKKRFERKAPG
jgi:glycosyltransferase involved in cell wall biosynthesis